MSEPQAQPPAASDPGIRETTVAALLARQPADPLLVGNLPRPLARRLHSARGTRRHLRAIRMLLNAMLLLALLYTVTLTRALLIPLVLAAFIGLALNPLVAGGARWHLPRWLTASVLMIGLVMGIGSGIGLLAQPAAGWFHGAPAAIRSFIPKFRSMTRPLEAANRATQTLVTGSSQVVKPQAPAMSISAWDVVSTAPKVLAAVLSVLLLVFFFLIYGDTMLRRLVELTPSFAYKRHAVSIVRSFQTEVSRNLAMFANFLPQLRAIFTTAVLAIASMLYAKHADLDVFLPALTFAGITIVEGNLITPLIQGRSMRLSPIAILLWLLVWGWLWGIPGALLAVPMLTCAKLICERVRGWEWFALLVSR